jgi:hypothetical protein
MISCGHDGPIINEIIMLLPRQTKHGLRKLSKLVDNYLHCNGGPLVRVINKPPLNIEDALARVNSPGRVPQGILKQGMFRVQKHITDLIREK